MPDNYAYRGYIKDIYLELPDYKYHHSPLDAETENGEADEEIFIGRQKIKDKFLNILLEGKNNGAYLVTGYRGMGKTSFVQKTIQEYRQKVSNAWKKDVTSIHQINVSFAQSDLKEIDILRQLTKAMIDEAENNWWISTTKIFSLVNIFRFVAFGLSILFLYEVFFAGNLIFFSQHIKSILQKDNGNNLLFDVLSILLLLILTALVITYLFFVLRAGVYLISKILVNSTRFLWKHGKQIWKQIWKSSLANLKKSASRKIEKFNLKSFQSYFTLGLLLTFVLICFTVKNWGYIGRLNFFLSSSIQQSINYSAISDDNSTTLDTVAVTGKDTIKITHLQKQTTDTTFTEIIKSKNDTVYFNQKAFVASKTPNSRIIFFTLKTAVWIIIILLFFILLFVVNFSLFNYLHEFIIEERKIYEKLINLYERCNATITKEASLQSAATINIPFGFIQRNVKAYPIANSKEIEYELLTALKRYNSFKYYKKKFVIVFDELDKVEPTIGKGYYYDDTKTLEQYEFAQNQLNDLRQRKRVIINILASLKYFITEANARFIFIAGREMFDAALADIADRQSSISSIFHHIIYVDSFLKDKAGDSNGVTDLVELFLQRVLLPEEKEVSGFLRKYYAFLEKNDNKKTEENRSANLKVIFNLQNFIIYLTYRSNGSPKKLSKLMEEYIVSDLDKGGDIDLQECLNDDMKIVKIVNKSKVERRLFLKFNVNDQYKFGLITYLYRPFILTYSQFLKRYSDNVLVSTPYLMDHLIKFHPFAFSMQNLELLPEVVSVNRNPILRNFIEELVTFLNQNHIRETEIGLFEYKFFSKSANEIVFLSKVFEEESAAFNFTLDENYFIKVHLRKKIKDIRSSYRDFKEGGTFIHSISFLNTLLGDAFFFDQEFDEAILSYSDALQHLRDVHPMSYEMFVLYMRLSLKLGLVYEKMKSYETALSYYNDAIDKANKYMDTYGYKFPEFQKNIHRVYHLDEKQDVSPIIYGKPDQKIRIISFNELLQITNQAYIASLYIQEKLSIEGVTMKKIENYYKNFVEKAKKVGETDDRSYLLLSNFDSNIGTMLYYKNLTKSSTNRKYTVTDLLTGIFEEKVSDTEKSATELLKGIFEEKESIEFNKHTNTSGSKDYRFSLQAFGFYKSALIRLSENPIDNDAPLVSIVKEFALKLEDYENIYTKAQQKNIAHVLSKIADCLLSAYSKPNMSLGESLQNDSLFKIAEFWQTQYDLKNEVGILIEKQNNDLNKNIDENELKNSINKWAIKSNHKERILKMSGDELIAELNNLKQGYRPMAFLDLNILGYLKSTTGNNELEYILALYYLSGRYYSKAGKNVSFSFQLRKILQVIKHNVKFDRQPSDTNKVDNQSKFIKFIEEAILGLILELTSRNSYASDRPQVYKFKNNFGNDNIYHPTSFTKYIYSNLSNNPEVKEALLLYADIKVQSIDFGTYKSLKDIVDSVPEMSLIHPYAGISSQFTRFQELDIQEKVNRNILETYLKTKFKFEGDRDVPFYKEWEDKLFKIYKQMNPDKTREYNDKIISDSDVEKVESFINRLSTDIILIEEYNQIVASSIFALIQITNILRIYDVNYYLCYSYLGNFHRKLGDWLKHYKLCQELRKKYEKDRTVELPIDKYLKDMLGEEVMLTLDTTSQYQIALQHYHRAKQVHSNGNAYETQIRNFIYLEDDFNDNLYHFGIALERQYINSYHLRRRIKEMELELKDSPLYRYDSFANNELFFP